MKKNINDIEIVEDEKKIKKPINNKIFYNIIGVVVIVVLIVLGLIFFVFNDNKKQLTKELENVGKNFYENYYYDKVGKDEKERPSLLSKYSTRGIKVDLENLASSSGNKDELLNKFVNKKTKEKCNEINTKVTIYPKDPYGRKDYTIEVELDCGFKK